MTRHVFTNLYIITIAVLGSISHSEAVFAATELAKINNSIITLEDFEKKYRDNLRFFQSDKPSKKGVLDDLIKRELAIQEAVRLGLDKDPEVQDRMHTVLYNALLERKLAKEFDNIHVTDDEAKAYYSKNPEIRTSHIFVAVRPGAKATEQKTALDKLKKVLDEELSRGKTSFAEIAQRKSEGPTAAIGGDLDYQTKDKLDPAYYAAALRLGSPGNVSGVVRSHFGYHIIKLTGVRSWDETDKAHTKRLVFEEHRLKIFEKYMTSLRAQAGNGIRIHPELIKD